MTDSTSTSTDAVLDRARFGADGLLPAIEAGADAVLAASVFHTGQLTVDDVKRELASSGILVRRPQEHS